MGSAKAQTLSTESDMPLPCSFSLLLPSEQALLEPAIVELLVFLAKLEAVEFITVMPPDCLTMKSEPYCLIVLLISLLSAYFPFSFYLK